MCKFLKTLHIKQNGMHYQNMGLKKAALQSTPKYKYTRQRKHWIFPCFSDFNVAGYSGIEWLFARTKGLPAPSSKLMVCRTRLFTYRGVKGGIWISLPALLAYNQKQQCMHPMSALLLLLFELFRQKHFSPVFLTLCIFIFVSPLVCIQSLEWELETS